MRPRFPAFANRLGVIVDVDLFQTANTASHRFRGIFIPFPDQFEEGPEKWQRKKTQIGVPERGFHFDVSSLIGIRGIADGQANRQPDGERSENRGHGVFTEERFRAVAGDTRLLFCLLPSIASRGRNLTTRLAQAAAGILSRSRASHRFRHRFVLNKVVVIWPGHTFDSQFEVRSRFSNIRSGEVVRYNKQTNERSNMTDPTKEEAYWRENHEKQAFAEPGKEYEHYAPAYRTGYEGFHKYAGKAYEEIETDLALDYEKHQVGSALPWDHARHAVHAAWAKLSNDIGPRDPDRGIRSGF